MTANHTPGPWHVSDGSTGSILVYDENGCRIADCETAASFSVNCANARLIAAAPELLEALRACEPILIGALAFVDCKLQLAMLRDAIAKAEGRNV